MRKVRSAMREKAPLFVIAIAVVLIGIAVNIVTDSSALSRSAALGAALGGLLLTLLGSSLQLFYGRRAQRQEATETVSEYRSAVETVRTAKANVRTELLTLERFAQGDPGLRQEVINELCRYLRSALPNGILTTSLNMVAENDIPNEVESRLLAQSILSHHLRSDPRFADGLGNDLESEFWPGMDIDLRTAILLHFNFEDCHVRHASFERATFSGVASFKNAVFDSYALFSGTTFSDDAAFDQAVFSGDAVFDASRFRARASYAKTQFAQDVVFTRATLMGPVNFTWVIVDGLAAFDLAAFDSEAVFNRASFNGTATFRSARFLGPARFESALFKGSAWFANALFEGPVSYDGCAFFADAVFTGARFESSLSLGNIDSLDPVVFVRLGALLREQGRVKEAETWLRRAAEAGQTSGMARLGALLLEQGRVKEAETWLRRAADAGQKSDQANGVLQGE
jgi:uncharacterized protein YjbI with pentapeptide repeats